MRDRSRPGGRARPHRQTRSRDALYTAYGDRQVSTILRAERSIRGDPGAAAASSRAIRRRSGLLYVRSSSGTLVPLEYGGDAAHRHRAVDDLARRAAAVRDDLLQSEAGHLARRGGGGIEQLKARAQSAGRACSAAFRARRRRSSLRSAAWACCCCWRWSRSISCSACCTRARSIRSRFFPACRAAGLGALVTLLIFGVRARSLRVPRAHHADRHREEERDHDDRLRARGAAQATARTPADAIFEACVLRFRPIMMTTLAALAATLPDRAGLGRRRRVAAAARPRRRRRLSSRSC